MADESDDDVTSLPARAAVELSRRLGSELEVEVAPGQADSPRVPDGEATPVDETSLGDKVVGLAADAADALLRDDELGDEALDGVTVDDDADAVRAPQRAATTRRESEVRESTNPPMPMPHVHRPEGEDNGDGQDDGRADDDGGRADAGGAAPDSPAQDGSGVVDAPVSVEAPERPATTKRGGAAVVASPLLTMPRVRHPEAIVLFVHGGDVEGHLRMRRGDPAYLRIVPFARDVERRSRGRIGGATLRLAVRGWNEPEKPAVEDTRWALGELRDRYPGVRLAIAGHSMGGRVALDIASSEDVAAVVALAPWAAEAYEPATFRTIPLLGIHGRRDTVTNPVATKKLIDDVAALGGDARFVSMPGWHAMLWGAPRWHRETSRFLIDHLLDGAAPGDGDRAIPATGVENVET